MSDDFDDFDVGLFGTWGDADDAPLMGLAQGVLLEMKSAEALRAEEQAASDMRPILNEATLELRKQFETFRGLRCGAEVMLADGDEAAQKLARADIKAAIDAMSLIVRTLEKIDSLQRQFARDRQAEAERVADQGGYQEALREVERLIDERAEERYRQRCLAAGLDPEEPGGAAGDGAPPPDTG
ncbi:hypothetical protein AAIH70_03660 [Neorhizobium sp. BT27B]|uniref:hypothetical protein n=1 Tax=Neorhizobium sp. BT27B TaxID=3142625 RepID=UPI003D2C45BD